MPKLYNNKPQFRIIGKDKNYQVFIIFKKPLNLNCGSPYLIKQNSPHQQQEKSKANFLVVGDGRITSKKLGIAKI